MTGVISSRCPEGESSRCPICRNVAKLEPSFPGGDAPCPSCGHLLWFSTQPVSRYRQPARRTLAVRVRAAASIVSRFVRSRTERKPAAEPAISGGVWDAWLDA